MKDRVKRLEGHLADFKKDIDSIIDTLAEEEAARDRKLANEGNVYSKEYLDEYAKNWKPKHNYTGVLQDIRDRHTKIIEDDLRSIQRTVDEVFTENPDLGFSAKVTAYYSMGLANELTPAEFESLRRQARNYSELRLLERLAASRTKTENRVRTGENGELKAEQREVPNPFRMRIPNIEGTYKSLENFSDAALNIIKGYVGADLGRAPKDDLVALGLADFAKKHFEHGWSEDNLQWMEDVSSLQAMNPPRAHELTPRERRMNSVLTDFSEYPTLAPQKAVQVVRTLPELRDQFLADSRFKDAILADEKKVG